MEQLQFTDSLEDINKELQARPRRFKTYTDLAEEAEFEQKTGISSKILARVEQKEIKEFVNKALAFADSNEDMILKIIVILQNKPCHNLFLKIEMDFLKRGIIFVIILVVILILVES